MACDPPHASAGSQGQLAPPARFRYFYGTIIGAGSFYDPATLCRGNTFITPVNDKAYQPETYYYTHAINDNAVAYLQEHAEDPDKPFFLYVAHTAAHWRAYTFTKRYR